MGQTCGCPNKIDSNKDGYTNMDVNRDGPSNINDTIIDDTWSKAVFDLSLPGIKLLHQDDPSLVNKRINNSGEIAIHYICKHKNKNILIYLINNGSDIDCKEPKTGNTPLHIVCNNYWYDGIILLLTKNANDNIKNKNNKTPSQLIKNKKHKHNYNLLKKRINMNTNNYSNIITNKNIIETNDDIQIGGFILNDKNRNEIIKLNDKNKHKNYYKKKKIEIKNRGSVPITSFGEDIGCDVDEIALTLQYFGKKQKLWEKWTNKFIITKHADIYKVMFGLTLLTLKNKQKRKKIKFNPRLNTNSIKKITNIVIKMLPKQKNKRNCELTKHYFCNDFFIILYKCHEKLIQQDEQQL